MYTGLRAKCVVKPEFRKAIDTLHNSEEDEFPCWQEVANKYPQYEFFKEWAAIGRSSFIPFGAMCYMDDSWGESFSEYDPKTGYWNFACSLKNYEGEIEFFLENVLANIVERVYFCEKQYEIDESPTKCLID